MNDGFALLHQRGFYVLHAQRGGRSPIIGIAFSRTRLAPGKSSMAAALACGGAMP